MVPEAGYSPGVDTFNKFILEGIGNDKIRLGQDLLSIPSIFEVGPLPSKGSVNAGLDPTVPKE